METFLRYINSEVECLVMNGKFGDVGDEKDPSWSLFDNAIAATIKDRKHLKALFVPAPSTGEEDRKRQQEAATGSCNRRGRSGLS